MAANKLGEFTEEEDVHELMIELRRSEPGNYPLTFERRWFRKSKRLVFVAMCIFEVLMAL